MKRVVEDCDRCGAVDLGNPVHLRLRTGTYHDPCEGAKQDFVDLELCPGCAAWSFERIFKTLAVEDRVEVVERLRNFKKTEQ